ncbi:carotenoid oxygenase family protein [Streptomyces sp. NPDC047017]|uniref:carotenoid oxygenase family protein n=1 Tax=Streptomyces sp. NPDC047017 TaxID=3155024 RepID=UPI0033DD2570
MNRPASDGPGCGRRWVVDPTAGEVDEQNIDGLAVEFPARNDDFLGAEHRCQYAVSFPDQEGFGGYGVVKYDRATGGRRIHQVGDARLPQRPCAVGRFRPAADKPATPSIEEQSATGGPRTPNRPLRGGLATKTHLAAEQGQQPLFR